MHATGAHIYMAVRDVQKGHEVAKEILESSSNKAAIDILELHLDSLDSVRACAAKFMGISRKLNILINNAGSLPLSPHLPPCASLPAFRSADQLMSTTSWCS